MRGKVVNLLVLMVFLSSWAWYFRDTQTVRQWRPLIEKGLAKLGVGADTVRHYWPLAPAPGASPEARPSTAVVLASPSGIQKCSRGGETIYTDKPCPSGSQTQAVSKGSVTVVEAPPAPAAKVAAAPSNPAQQAHTLRDQSMDRVIGQ